MFNLKTLTFCLLCLLPLSVNAAQEFTFVGAFGGKGEADGAFAKTLSMAFGADGAVYVTDTDNLCIQKFSATGEFVFSIQMTQESRFRFINPTDIAVGTDGSLYVMDWLFTEVSAPQDPDAAAPKRFTYGPCVHKFDPQGVFVASYPVQESTEPRVSLAAAVPGLDAAGNYALVLPQGDTQRRFLLATDSHDTLYICDSDAPNKPVTKLDADGSLIARYTLEQPKAAHVADPVDIAADADGNLYVVDQAGHQVLKYDPDGRFERAFGGYGDGASAFIAPFRIAALGDGTLLVADTAKYLKDFASTLPSRLDAPRGFAEGGTRRFRYRLRRVQRFTATGGYAGRYLIPFQREAETDTHLHLKGIDRQGNLYYLDTATLQFRKYAPTDTLFSSLFQTELKLRYTRDLHDIEIDNQDDLDAGLYTSSDFDEQIVQDAAHANVTLSYDFNESYRLALTNRLTYVRMTDTSYYRAREFEDFRGQFNQDDRATESSWDDRVQVDFTWVRDHSLYNYREARAFAYFSLIRVDFANAALDTFNLRYFDFNANLSDWGAGFRYDFSRTFRLNFEVTHFFGENRYTYIDETGVLYATGFQEGGLTRAVLFINGIF